jgi:hypothetical protein
MDESVLRGLAKWPNVPAVYGWLSLDRRGNWLIRKERIGNPVVTAFIGRNYERDSEGRWFFQNGPQRVFVELEYTPLVYRTRGGEGAPIALECHTGEPVTSISGAWIDEAGSLLLETEHGPGALDDRDLPDILPALVDKNGEPLSESELEETNALLERGAKAPLWHKRGVTNVQVDPIRQSAGPERFRFVQTPAP